MKIEDLNKAMAGFLIAMGQTLPAGIAIRIQQQALLLAEEMDRNGEPSVAKLTRGFGNAVMAAHQPPDSTH